MHAPSLSAVLLFGVSAIALVSPAAAQTAPESTAQAVNGPQGENDYGEILIGHESNSPAPAPRPRLRPQDSNLDLTAPKAVVLPLHQGGSRRTRESSLPERSIHDRARKAPTARATLTATDARLLPRNNEQMTARDEVDRIVEAWRRERPELDVEPLQVLSRVSRLARHLDLARKQAFAASALESWEFDVLSALRRAGKPYELSPKALLQQTLVSSGTMTNRIDRLTTRGLVERRTDPNDGRSIRVRMTDEGRVRVDRAIDELMVSEAALLQQLSRPDQEKLAGLLRTLSADFDDE